MRRGKLRSLALLLVLFLFAAGLAVFLYPYLWGAMVDREISLNAQGFLNRAETAPTAEVIVTIDSIEPTAPENARAYPKLWADMVRYNETIYTQGQTGLSCAYDYQKPSFRLMDYGLEDEVFGVISIPAMELEMPIFLGATEQHMADGAAHLSQTSLPIGGENTNYPYVWGGSSPSTSFDCSGFICWVINHSGWSVGRTSAQGLYNLCTPVSRSNARPGDLVFFKGTYKTPGVSHVGIYVGNNRMLHCGDPISYTNINTQYWQSHFFTFGRLP